jgi:hypothetical protein
VCDALVGFEQVVVTGSGQAQTNFRNYVTDAAVVLPRVMFFVVNLRYEVGLATDAHDLRVTVIKPDERV